MAKRGQGAFEYILLLAGVLLIVVLAIIILRGTLTGGNQKEINKQACLSVIAKTAACYDGGGNWLPNGCNIANGGGAAADACDGWTYGVDTQKCLWTNVTTSGLTGTSYWFNVTHFRCGARPN
jgi:hypothetical protein